MKTDFSFERDKWMNDSLFVYPEKYVSSSISKEAIMTLKQKRSCQVRGSIVMYIVN